MVLAQRRQLPLHGFLEPCYIKEKGILMSGLEVFNIAFYLVEKEVLTIGRED